MSAVSSTLKELGLAANEIARRTGLSIERVKEILDGGAASLGELYVFSEQLRLPLSAFLAAGDLSDATQILFRSTQTPNAPDSSIRRTARFVDTALRMLPERTRPPAWLEKLQVAEENYQEAERIATEFRALFYSDRVDDPALDLARVLVAEGVVIGRLRRSQYEGASLIANGYPFILVSTRYIARMLFTLAHELGHVIAHHNASAPPIFERSSNIAYGRRRSTREHFVDAFASVLLLPAGGVAIALEKIREVFSVSSDAIGDLEILLLARFFGVSFEVAARRCEDLELLPPGGARSLHDKLVQDYGNPERRADAVSLPPRPEVEIPEVSDNLMRAVVENIQRGEVSVGWAAASLGVSVGLINAANAKFASELRH